MRTPAPEVDRLPPDLEAEDDWLEFHGRQMVDDLVRRFKFAKTRHMLATWLCEAGGNGRPVIIDHIQEPRP